MAAHACHCELFACQPRLSQFAACSSAKAPSRGLGCPTETAATACTFLHSPDVLPLPVLRAVRAPRMVPHSGAHAPAQWVETTTASL
jgi:hypothetical protein